TITYTPAPPRAGKVTAAGQLDAGGHAAEFGLAADRQAVGGPIAGHFHYQNHDAGGRIRDATLTVLTFTGTRAAPLGGPATCTIGGHASSCAFSIDATEKDTFTLTYGTTTVGGAVRAGHVHVEVD